MSDTVLIGSKALFGATVIDNRFIEEYMPGAPDNAVKVYLYGLYLLSSGSGDAKDIALALGIEEAGIEDAFRYWERIGLVRIAGGESDRLAVQYLPVPAADSNDDVRSYAKYRQLIEKLQAVLGTRNLSGSELQRIYDWIEVFRFEEDAAVEIVRHCIAIKGARVHINYMDSVAKRLAADGILTLDAVKASFDDERVLTGGAGSILKRWHISRRPTDDELALYEKWIREWGFTDDAISIALSDVVAVDRPNFKYLDAILSSYRQKGSVTPEGMKELIREQDLIRDLAQTAFERAGMKRRANTADRQQFELWLHDYAMSAELVLYAAELSSAKSTPFAEMKRIVDDWHKRGIASFEAAKKDAEASGSRTAKPESAKKVNRALNYKQKQYTAEDLKRLGIDLGEDVYSED